MTIAKQKGNDFEIFNAELSVIKKEGDLSLTALDERYEKEAEKVENNEEALTQLIANKATERKALEAKNLAAEDKLFGDFAEKAKDRAAKAKNEGAKLAIAAVKQSGKDPFTLEKVLLVSDMAAELENVNLTEIEKANIKEKFRQANKALEDNHNLTRAEKTAKYFAQAFDQVLSVMKARIDNAMISEDNRFNARIKNLDLEKDKGIKTDRQIAAQKALLEREHDAATRKLKRKAAELDKAATITRIIESTALAIMKAAPNVPLQIAEGAMGAIQLGIAASAKIPGYDVGGYPKNDANQNTFGLQKPTNSAQLAWVNEKGPEYIIPNWQVNDPVMANTLAMIEYRRKNQITGFEMGGNTGKNGSSITNHYLTQTNQLAPEHIDMFINAVNLFAHHSQNMVPNLTIGHEDVQKMENLKADNKRTQAAAFAPYNSNMLR